MNLDATIRIESPLLYQCQQGLRGFHPYAYHRSISVSERIRDLIAKSQSEDSAVSWPAMRLLGLLAERHFTEAAAALEKHGGCQELDGLEADLERINSEVAPPKGDTMT